MLKNNSCPKVLVVSGHDFFNEDNQTSITLRSFFEKWPKEKIATLICGSFNVKKRGLVDNRTFFLSIKDVKFLKYFLKEKRTPSSFEVNTGHLIPENTSIFFKVRKTLKLFLTDSLDFFPYKCPTSLFHFIDDFNPEVIYTNVENARICFLLQEIQNRKGLSIVPHFFDDFPTTIYSANLSKIQKFFFNKKLKKLIAQAPACLCISEAMCTEYTKRYKRSEFFPLMNSVEKFYGNANFELKPSKERKLRICYAGTLHYKRDEILILLCHMFILIKDLQFEFTIYTPEKDWNTYKNRFNMFENVMYGGYKDRENIFTIMCESDILVHVESFDNSIQNVTRFSISTKIPEYLSTGNIILSIGPRGIASIDYLAVNSVAYIIDDINDNFLFKKILNSIFNNNNAEIKKNAKTLFEKNHLKMNNRESLIRVLNTKSKPLVI